MLTNTAVRLQTTDDEYVYELLRTFHSSIKDLLNEELSPEQENAIETLHGLLYLVEKEFTDF